MQNVTGVTLRSLVLPILTVTRETKIMLKIMSTPSNGREDSLAPQSVDPQKNNKL